MVGLFMFGQFVVNRIDKMNNYKDEINGINRTICHNNRIKRVNLGIKNSIFCVINSPNDNF